MNAHNEPGAIANISALFADSSISIEALMQHESKIKPSSDTDSDPVVILSGPVTDSIANKLKSSLEDMDEIKDSVRIIPGTNKVA